MESFSVCSSRSYSSSSSNNIIIRHHNSKANRLLIMLILLIAYLHDVDKELWWRNMKKYKWNEMKLILHPKYDHQMTLQ